MSIYCGSQSMLFIVLGLCGALASATTTTTTSTPASTSTTTTTAQGASTTSTTITTSTGFLATTTTTTAASMSTTTTTSAQGPSLVATDFVKYYDSNTTFDVHGWVGFEQILSSSEVPGQSLTWDLSGVDPACKIGSGNQCGIHIYEGTSCTENAEGHYWNETLVNSDPWTMVQYNTNKTTNETSQGEAGVRVISGLEMEEIVGHAVIVHDSVAPGRRIACALIKEITTSTTKPPSSNGFPWLIVMVAVAAVLVIGGAAVGGYFYFKDPEDKSSV